MRKGSLRALAAGTGKRLAALPEVPTFDEAGVANFNADGFNVVMVRAGTPKEILDRLNREIQRSIATPELAKAMEALSVLPNSANAEQSLEFMKCQVDSWSGVVKTLGIVLD